MFRVVTRHNINLDREELACIAGFLLGDPPDAEEALNLFEKEMAAYHGVGFAVGLSSGRAALYAILAALDLPDKAEVVLPAYSFFSIPDVVRACGLTPVFAPCDPLTYCLAPERLESVMTERTAAVVVEHPFGQPAPLAVIAPLVEKRGAVLIEDPSQSIGASLNGRMVGSYGRASCLSLVHGKNLMTFGGGMLLSDDGDLVAQVRKMLSPEGRVADKGVRKVAAEGLVKWALSSKPGFMFGPFIPFYLVNLLSREKLDELFEEERSEFNSASLKGLSQLQAALGRLQLTRMDGRNEIRRKNALTIMEELGDVESLMFQTVVEGGRGTWNALAVRVANRTRVQRELFIHGVDSRRDYMSIFAFEDEWKSAGEVFYLPNHPGMNEADLKHVIRWAKRVMTIES